MNFLIVWRCNMVYKRKFENVHLDDRIVFDGRLGKVIFKSTYAYTKVPGVTDGLVVGFDDGGRIKISKERYEDLKLITIRNYTDEERHKEPTKKTRTPRDEAQQWLSMVIDNMEKGRAFNCHDRETREFLANRLKGILSQVKYGCDENLKLSPAGKCIVVKSRQGKSKTAEFFAKHYSSNKTLKTLSEAERKKLLYGDWITYEEQASVDEEKFKETMIKKTNFNHEQVKGRWFRPVLETVDKDELVILGVDECPPDINDKIGPIEVTVGNQKITGVDNPSFTTEEPKPRRDKFGLKNR